MKKFLEEERALSEKKSVLLSAKKRRIGEEMLKKEKTEEFLSKMLSHTSSE